MPPNFPKLEMFGLKKLFINTSSGVLVYPCHLGLLRLSGTMKFPSKRLFPEGLHHLHSNPSAMSWDFSYIQITPCF